MLAQLLCGAIATATFIHATPAGTAAPAASIGAGIAFQAHSYNDFRSWQQLFRKGATHIKIDPNFRAASFCSSQERDSAKDPRGCFVFNHDTPTIFSRRLTYNTTKDLLALLSDKTSALYAYVCILLRTVRVAVCSHSVSAC